MSKIKELVKELEELENQLEEFKEFVCCKEDDKLPYYIRKLINMNRVNQARKLVTDDAKESIEDISNRIAVINLRLEQYENGGLKNE